MLEGQKLLCINAENQKVLKTGKIYTVDRVYVKEWKRFSFSKDRFKLLGEN